MAYIQITTRCNMECSHCCYSCTSEGIDMDESTFKAACKIAEDYEDYITLGGGEPTIHPKFWQFIGVALGHASSEMGVYVVTNGKKKKTALRLARASRGLLSSSVSNTQYHEGIDSEVLSAFKRKDGRQTAIRGVLESVSRVGRGANVFFGEDRCVCNELFITPLGEIFSCACKVVSFGTVREPKIDDEIREKDYCRGIESKREEEVANG